MAKKSETKANSKKKIIIIALAVLLLAVVGVGIALFMPSKKITVAFYKIEDRQRQGITEVLSKIAEEKNIDIVFTQYDSEKSLKEQLLLSKKPNIIFTVSGFAVDSAVEKASKRAGIPSEAAQGMTSSIRSALKFDKTNTKILALPILSSHFEVDINTSEFRNSNTKQINSWNDVEKFMREQKRKKESPMIFAGGNPDFFLDLLGAFAESLDGISSYTAAVKILKENEKSFSFNAVSVAKALCDEPNSPLATTVKQLSNWYKQGLIHQGAFSLQLTDVEAFATGNLASVLFMPLETHRNFAQNTISRFTSIYFPSEFSANSRIFTGNIYYAVEMKKSKDANALISELVSPVSQETLSRATGIAPVLAQCRTPDKQADDARYWIAATTAPLAGLSREAYLTKEQKISLAAEIAARVRN